MTRWEPIEGTGYPDQRGEVAFPFYAEVGPESDGKWSWTLLRANADGTQTELTGSGPSAHADSEELAKTLAEAAGLGALAQFETAEQPDGAIAVTHAQLAKAFAALPLTGYPGEVTDEWRRDLADGLATALMRELTARVES